MKTNVPTGVSPITFGGSAIIAVGLILYASLYPEAAAEHFATANDWIIAEVGWLYMLSVGIFVVFLIGVALSSLGTIKLGPADSEPEYSYGTWVAMLFSAGMGIGIVFYGVAEPIMHFSNPPDAEPRSIQAARDAMEVTFFHWGVHAWAIYAVIGLSLAFFGYRYGQPLILRSAFRPLIGDKADGPIGDVIDIFAVVGTLAGLSTSLGLGVAQLNATMNYLFGLPQTMTIQVVLIVIVTILATITVATGLDAGIRRLSEGIILVSFLLMALILFVGPARFLLQSFVENIGLYVNGFVSRTFHIYAYDPNDWVAEWTLFYWGWWISWSPFVGMFIARISRGRTVRQFLLGVLFAPAGFSILWFTIFGDVAIWLDLNVANGDISRTVADNMPIALFTVFEYLPWATLLSWMTGLLVLVYFVTASDAGALVVAMITSKGDEEPVLWLRVFWALACGGVAACLLLAGGLEAVQMVAVIAALPLTVVMLFMCYGIWKALSAEMAIIAGDAATPTGPIASMGAASWERRLSALVRHPNRRQAEAFMERAVVPALEAIISKFEEENVSARLDRSADGLTLSVHHGELAEDFVYAVRLSSQPIPAFAMTDAARRVDEKHRYFRAEAFVNGARRGYDLYGCERDQVIADVVHHYDRFRRELYGVNAEPGGMTLAPAT